MKELLIILMPILVCIATTLLSVGCDAIGVSCNLGARLDSVGKNIPIARQTGAKYTLNDKLYSECEVSYRSVNTPIVQFKFGHLYYWNGHEDAPSSTPVRYLLALNGHEIISAKDFDYKQATRSTKPKFIGHGVPSQYCTRFRLLSADFDKSQSATQVNLLPEQRSTGNYLRTPLVAAISWGIDVPLTLAGNAILYTLTGVGCLIDAVL